MLGDVSNKRILHLQCHFGQDSISLARMGAEVTAVDFSNKAIEKANELNKLTGQNVNFICSDIYKLPEILNDQFDIVFTSYGVIGWLPDMKKWAKVVSNFLNPNGQFFLVEFHPFIWMWDDDFTKIQYSYFNDEPIEEKITGSYTDGDHKFEQEIITWNHPISDVLNSLIGEGLSINSFQEFDYSPYDCFNKTVEIEESKYIIKSFNVGFPLIYALNASKN